MNNINAKRRLFSLKRIILLASIIWMPFFAMSQYIEVKGVITNLKGEAIPNAIIIASYSNSESNIIAFYNSKNNGEYKLVVKKNTELDSLWLTVKHIAYKDIKMKIAQKNCSKNFTLTDKIQELEEVLLKTPKKIMIKGDTITYNVKGIKTKKDYTIEDVINRIPGVTISENGQISYLDKPITHLYINGVDLLEGKYNIATQGIPADAVKEIDILKKHNHERINIGRIDSDDVAFNLKIKEGVGLVFGSIKSDAGIPLISGLIEATPIYFKNNFQNISSFKSNNIGKTLRNTSNNLTANNLNILGMKLEKTPIIRPPNVNGVVISDKFWLDNNSYTITNNALHKLNDSTLLKWHINYTNELSEIEKKSSSTFIINNDSSLVVNNNKNSLRKQGFQFGLNQEINKRRFYAKNNTTIEYYDNSGKENSILNNNNVISNFENFDLKLNNTTYFKTLISNKNIIESGVLVEYNRQFEKLLVIPPVFENILTNNETNTSTLQDIKINAFNIGGFSQYNFKLFNLKWHAYQKIQYSKVNFNSYLKALPQLEFQDFPFSSDYSFNKLNSISRINTIYNLKKITIKWRFTGDFINLDNKEKNNININQNKSFFFIQPFASVGYKINTKWNFGISYSQESKISNFTELYPVLILENYNSLVQNPQFINKTKLQVITPFINYSNILKSFYFNAKSRFKQTKSNVTFVNQLNEDGFVITDVIERPNTTKNASFSLNLSKGFLGTFNSNLSYTYNYSENEMFFNNAFLTTINTRHNVNLDLNFDNESWYNIQYTGRLNLGHSKLPQNKVTNFNFFQTVDLDFYTSSSTRLNFGLESSKTSTSTSNKKNINTLFNMSFFYKPSKKMYLRASFINIFNTRFFSITNSGINFVNTSQFSLRPRQFTIGFSYSL